MRVSKPRWNTSSNDRSGLAESILGARDPGIGGVEDDMR